MLSTKEVSIVYETLLTSPGMNDNVKIDFRIPRKNVLLLSKIIELGLSVKDENMQVGLLAVTDAETLADLRSVVVELLKKAGLTEMNDKLQALQPK